MSDWKDDYFRTFRDSEIILDIKSINERYMKKQGNCSDVSKDFCEKAVQNDKEKRCSLMLRGLQYGMIRKVSEFCPVACSTCRKQTLYQTMQPSNRPSKQTSFPTMQPSNSRTGMSSISIFKDTEEVFKVFSDTKPDNFTKFQMHKQNLDLGIYHKSRSNLKESSQDTHFTLIPANLVYIFTFLIAFLTAAVAYHKYCRNQVKKKLKEQSFNTGSSQTNSDFEHFGESSPMESEQFTGENALVTVNSDQGHNTVVRKPPSDIEYGAFADPACSSTAIRLDCPKVALYID